MANIEFQLAPHYIASCGITIKHGSGDLAGNFSQVCNDIHNWFCKNPQRPIEECCTYTLTNESTGSHKETYLISSKKDQYGNYFFIFWNRSEKNGTTIFGINQQAKTGTVTNKSNFGQNNLPKDHIPGFATYYWAIPSKNIIVNFIPQGSKTCRGGFYEWMHAFIAKYSTICEISSDGKEILGYKIDGKVLTHHKDKELIPRFTSRPVHTSPRVKLLIENRTSIKSIIRHTKLKYVVKSDQDVFFGLLGAGSYRTDNIVLKFEAAVQPTEDELMDMIEKCTNGDLVDKVGFTFPSGLLGLKKKEWLDDNCLRSRYSENMSWVQPGALLEPNSLISAIHSRQNAYFAELDSAIIK